MAGLNGAQAMFQQLVMEGVTDIFSLPGAQIMSAFDDLNEEGRTIIIITHDPVVSKHARRILTLRDGRVVSDQINENFKESRSSPTRIMVE